MSHPGKPTADEVRARLRVVCICNGIRLGRISDAIRGGASTVQAVNRATGSGSGDCGATRCGPVIADMVRNGGRPPAPAATAPPRAEADDYWFPTPVLKKKPE